MNRPGLWVLGSVVVAAVAAGVYVSSPRSAPEDGPVVTVYKTPT